VNRRGIALFAADYPHDYPEVEATVMLVKHKLRLVEVPVAMRERGGGASSITAFRSVYYMTKVLLAIFVGLFRRYAVPLEEEHRSLRFLSRSPRRSRRSCCSSSSSS